MVKTGRINLDEIATHEFTLDQFVQAYEVCKSGVGGVTMGRFVWDYRDVTALVVALRYIIHKGYSVKEAKKLLAQLENDKNYSEF